MPSQDFAPVDITIKDLIVSKLVKRNTRTRSTSQILTRTLLHIVGFSCLTLAGFVCSIVAGLVVAGISCFALSWLSTPRTTPDEMPDDPNGPSHG